MSQENEKQLPDGWQWVNLGDICEQDRQIVEPRSKLWASLTYLSLEHIESQSGEILKSPSVPIEDEGFSTTFAFNSNHILYGKLRPYLNKVAVPNFYGRCTTELIPLLPKPNVDRLFLAWLLRRKETVEKAMQGKTGARMPRADMSDLLNLKVPLPPLSEQKLIASLINEQLEAVGKARQAAVVQLKAANNLSAAYLREVFDSEKTKNWARKRFEDIARLERGKFTPRPRNDPRYYGGQYPWIQTGEVEAATKYIKTYRNTLNEDGLGVSKLFSKGTLVITIAATIGAVGILDFDSCMPDSLVGITPYENISDTEFLYYSLLYIRNNLKSIAPQVAQANLRLELLKPIEIQLPTFSKQKEISSTLNAQMREVERIKLSLQDQLDGINKLPSALLERAFSGGL